MNNDIEKQIKIIEDTYPSPQKSQRELFKIGVRRCCNCKNVKSIDEFGKNKHIFRRRCKLCENEIAKKRWHEKRKTQTLEEAIHYKFYQAKYRSEQKGRLFNLTVEDVVNQWNKQQGFCYYTGLKMEVTPNNLNHFSIDRIDSKIGYEPDNIVICTHVINLMKKDLSSDDFIDYCMLVVNNWSKNPK